MYISNSADVCSLEASCDFYSYFISLEPYNKELVLRNYLKPGLTGDIAKHWETRDKCCAAFTEMNTQFGMLSHARGLFYIGLVCVGMVINVCMMTDVNRGLRTMQCYGFNKTFPITDITLKIYKHLALVNILTACLVEPIVIHWNFIFWWDWSEEVCVYFQLFRQLFLVSNAMTVAFLQLTVIAVNLYPVLVKSKYLTHIPMMIWVVSTVVSWPTKSIWKLVINKPGQMAWYYDLQGIDVPQSIKKNIFNDVIIDGHFQCALPLQCMPNDFESESHRVKYKILNYIYHYFFPLTCLLYRQISSTVSVKKLRKRMLARHSKKNDAMLISESDKTDRAEEEMIFLQCVQKIWSEYLNLVIFGDFQNDFLAENYSENLLK